MLFVTLLICLGFINALPTTTKRCQALVENTPWTISDLTAFEAASNSSALSYISFHFCDVNPGLELETTCLRTIAPGTSASVIDPSTYYACNGNEVRFIYAGGSLSLERSYDDDCLGPPPYNGAIVGGDASTDVVNTTSTAGNTCSQDLLTVHITKQW